MISETCSAEDRFALRRLARRAGWDLRNSQRLRAKWADEVPADGRIGGDAAVVWAWYQPEDLRGEYRLGGGATGFAILELADGEFGIKVVFDRETSREADDTYVLRPRDVMLDASTTRLTEWSEFTPYPSRGGP